MIKRKEWILDWAMLKFMLLKTVLCEDLKDQKYKIQVALAFKIRR